MNTILPTSTEFLNAGAHWDKINPSNSYSTYTDRAIHYLGKPVRFVARLIYGIASVTIFPFVGGPIHCGKAFECVSSYGYTQAEKPEAYARAWKHLRAFGSDIYTWARYSILFIFAIRCLTVLSISSPVVPIVWGCTLFTPLKFALFPDSFKMASVDLRGADWPEL